MNKGNKYYNEKELREHNSNYQVIIKDTRKQVLNYSRYAYNCMGFALGIFDWLNLESFRDDGYYQDEEWLKETFEDCCQELEEVYHLRRLKRPVVDSPEERVIAFRIGFDDFHFARLNSDGTWSHKPGRNYIRPLTDEEIDGAPWCKQERICPYISEIAYFAVPVNRKEEYYYA